MSTNDPNIAPVLIKVEAAPDATLRQLNQTLQAFSASLAAALKQLPAFSMEMKKAAKDMNAVIGLADGGMGYDLRLARQRFIGAQGTPYYNAGVTNAKAGVRQQYSRAEKNAQFNNFFDLAGSKQKLTKQFVEQQLDAGAYKQMEKAFQARLSQLANTPNSATETKRVKERLDFIRKTNTELKEQVRIQKEAERQAQRAFSTAMSQAREKIGANYLNNPILNQGLKSNIDRTLQNQVSGGARQNELLRVLNDPKQLWAKPTAASVLGKQNLTQEQIATKMQQLTLQRDALSVKRSEALLGGDSKTVDRVNKLNTALSAQDQVLRNLNRQYGQLETQKTKTNKKLNDEIQLNRLRQKVEDFNSRQYANQRLPANLSSLTQDQLGQRSKDLNRDLAALEKQRVNATQVGDKKRADDAERYYNNLTKQKAAIDTLIKTEKQRVAEQQKIQNNLNKAAGGTYRNTDMTAQIRATTKLADLDQIRLGLRRDLAGAEKLYNAAAKANDQTQMSRAQNLIQMYSRERAEINQTQRLLNNKNSFQDRMRGLLSNEGQAGLFGIQATLMKNYLMMNAVVSAFSGGYSFLRDFEASLKQTQAISQATTTQMESLRNSIVEVSDASRFSAIELSDATTVLAQAGFSVKEIQTSLASVATLATATGSTLSDSVDIATSVLAAFNMAAENMPEIANQITQAMNLSKLDVPKFMLATQYAANSAADLGVSFREMLASVAAVSNTGIRSGSTMGTGMRQLMADLTAPTEKFKTVLTDLGLTLSDIDVRANGLTGVIKNLQQAGFTTSDAFESFELRATAFYVALANNIDAYDKLYSSMDSTTAAADAQKIQMNSLAAQTDRATNQFKLLAETAGGPLRTGLTATFRIIANLTEGLTDLISNGIVGFTLKAAIMTAGLWALFAAMKNVVVIGGTLLGWMAGSTLVAVRAALATGGLVTALKALWATVAPFRLLAMAAAITTTVLVTGEFTSKLDRMRATLERAQTDLNNTKDSITNYGNAFNEVNEKLKSLSSRSSNLAKDQNALGIEFDMVMRKATDLGVNLKTELGGSVQDLQNAWLELRAELGKRLSVDLSDVINQLGIVQQQKDNLFYQERREQKGKPFQNRKLGGKLPFGNGSLEFYDPLNPTKRIVTTAKGVKSFIPSSSPDAAPTGAFGATEKTGTYDDFLGQLTYLLAQTGTNKDQNLEFAQAFKRTSSLATLDPLTLSDDQKGTIYEQLQKDYVVLSSYRQAIFKLLAKQERAFINDDEMQDKIAKTRTSAEKVFTDPQGGLSSIYDYWQSVAQNARLMRSAQQDKAAQDKTNEYTDRQRNKTDNLAAYAQYEKTLDNRTLTAMANSKYDTLFQKYGQQENIDPALLKAVGFRESGFDPKAHSGKAAGLMQFTPDTAADYKLKNVYDAEQSIEAAAKYLSVLLKRFNGSVPLALAGYNAGPNGSSLAKGQIPNIPETQDYVKKVMASYLHYSGGMPMGRIGVRPESATPTNDDGRLTELRGRAAYYEDQIITINGELSAARKAKDEAEMTRLSGELTAARKEKSTLDADIASRLKTLRDQASSDSAKEILDIEIEQLQTQGKRLDIETELASLTDADKNRKLELLAIQDKLNREELARNIEIEKRKAGKFAGSSYALSLSDREALKVELESSMEYKKLQAQYASDKREAEKKYTDFVREQYEQRTKAAAKTNKEETDQFKDELKRREESVDTFIAYTKTTMSKPLERLKAERKNMDRADRANQYTDVDRDNLDRRIAKMEAETTTTVEIMELQEKFGLLSNNNEIYQQKLEELRTLAVRIGAERSEILEQVSGDVLNSQYVVINDYYQQITENIKTLSAELQQSQIELEGVQFSLDTVANKTPAAPNFAAQLQEQYKNKYQDMTSTRGQMENIQSVVEATRTGLIGVVEDLASASDGIDDFYKHIIDWSDETQDAFQAMGYSIVQTMMKIMLDRWTTQFMEFISGKIAKTGDGTGKASGILGLVQTGLGALLGGAGSVGSKAASAAASQGAGNMLANAGFALPGMATGGPITGGIPNRDSVPIMAMPGEYMLPTKTVDYIGSDFLDGLKNDPSATMKSLSKPVIMGGGNNQQETNVWVVSPEKAPAAPGPNDIVVAIAKNIAEGGTIKQLIKKVVQRG